MEKKKMIEDPIQPVIKRPPPSTAARAAPAPRLISKQARSFIQRLDAGLAAFILILQFLQQLAFS
jgi:hypothetical protein